MTTAGALSRNRNFTVLWAGQSGSEFGFHLFLLTYPLLALTVTGSPGVAGAVGFVLAATQVLVAVPAGLLADRRDRRGILLWCTACRAAAFGSLAVAVAIGPVWLPHLFAVAVVEGAAVALSFPAEDSALPQVVPPAQLPSALALNTARTYLGEVVGKAAGGFLFGLTRFAPFLAAAVLHVVSFVLLLALRLPARDGAPPGRAPLRREILAGVRWIVVQPVIAVISVCAVGLNLVCTALAFMAVWLAQQEGVPGAAIGVMLALPGVGGLLGAVVAARLHRLLGPYLSVGAVVWGVTATIPVIALVSDVYVIGAMLAVAAFLAPTANVTVGTYQLLLTPPELRGRLSGAMSVLDGTAAALGPVLGGLLLELGLGRGSLWFCAAAMAVPATLVACSGALRRLRPWADDAPPPPASVTPNHEEHEWKR